MKSRRGPWLVFGLCAVFVAAALSWITMLVLRLERAEIEARAEASHMEAVRLALWRMDSWLAPRLARESARPYYEYLPYYPQPQAYTRIFNVIDAGEVLTPSPLLSFQSPFFKVHFQIDSRGQLTSPQVPTGNMREVAEATVLPAEIFSCNRSQLDEVDALLRLADLREAKKLAEVCAMDFGSTVAAVAEPQVQLDEPSRQVLLNRPAPVQAALDPREWIEQEKKAQQQRSQMEQASRSKISSDTNVAYQTALPPQSGQTFWSQNQQMQQGGVATSRDDNGDVVVGPLVPSWIELPDSDPQLVFVRQVVNGHQESYQGFLVDWKALREAMLAEVNDLFDEATLLPVWSSVSSDEASARMLATVPVLLVSNVMTQGGGMLVGTAAGTAWMSPARTVVFVTWLAAIVALVAVGLTLHASISYGERRSRFASAVTHELRTPLTTFQMYSEMLAEGMVRSDDQRSEYLATLRDESKRLATLVENILAYARLEEGRHMSQVRAVPVHELIERVRVQLQRRAHAADMKLRIDDSVPVMSMVKADAEIVGQVLLNLIDNACKYAPPCHDRGGNIELRVEESPAVVRIIVEDNGPGIAEEHARRIFAPFDRGCRQEGDGTPGVGLGLALARGLARDLGGDLTLDQRCASGSRFVLTLPRA